MRKLPVVLKRAKKDLRSKLKCFRSYDALIGVTTKDWFHQQGSESFDRGINRETKEKYLRSYILNNYENHLKEIFLAVTNEYSEWDEVILVW